MPSTTNTSLGGDAWVIDDEVERLREWASDRVYPLPGDAEVTIGASDACTLQLVDPSGQLSRQHARMSREPTWL
ncbi:MAG TPA: FHA domain-containing protein, partial [Kofleriaceae bacterium]